jgi:hypothetical protein
MPLREEPEIREIPQFLELDGGHAGQFPEHPGRVGPRLPEGLAHLVEKRAGIVVPEPVVLREPCLRNRQ